VSKLLALRIDVDTYAGAVKGLPRLLDMLEQHGAAASIFIPGGPDRTGLAVIRLLTQKGYLQKLLRTGAFRVYGPSALAAGLLYRNRKITQAKEPISRAIAAGHELVAHGFVHTLWHNSLHKMTPEEIRNQVVRSVTEVERDLSLRPVAFGGPGWQANPASLKAVDEMDLEYASDARGRYPFLPRMSGHTFKTPQVPTTLPSLDEFVCGLPPREEDVARLYELMHSQEYPVYAAHAELEGRFYADYFQGFLEHCAETGSKIVTLGQLLQKYRASNTLAVCDVVQAPIPGRPGIVATQVI